MRLQRRKSHDDVQLETGLSSDVGAHASQGLKSCIAHLRAAVVMFRRTILSRASLYTALVITLGFHTRLDLHIVWGLEMLCLAVSGLSDAVRMSNERLACFLHLH